MQLMHPGAQRSVSLKVEGRCVSPVVELEWWLLGVLAEPEASKHSMAPARAVIAYACANQTLEHVTGTRCDDVSPHAQTLTLRNSSTRHRPWSRARRSKLAWDDNVRNVLQLVEVVEVGGALPAADTTAYHGTHRRSCRHLSEQQQGGN
eukprot:scaffold103335_cov60-Phaeocystis_antarctica.AAC.5